MPTVLIDEVGETWRPTDPRLKLHLLSDRDHYVLTKFVVENLGWVKIVATQRYVRVSCRPGLVRDQTLAALLIHLHENRITPIALDILLVDWEHRLIGDLTTFTRLISSLVAGHRQPSQWEGGRLLSQARSDPELCLHAASRMARVASGMAGTPDDIREPFDAIFGGRWHLSEVNWDNGHSVVAAIGSSFTPFNPRWSASGEGESVCSYADEDYGLWVSEHHRNVLVAKATVFDDVDAIVAFPRIGDTRLRYHRVTMPLSLRGGRGLVLSAAVTDSRIDLRKVAVQEGGEIVEELVGG